MKAVFKRFLAIAMVFVLVLGFMPANIAFADGTIYVTEEPARDPNTLTIVKETDGKSITAITDSDAYFKVEFFGNTTWTGPASRTWYYKTVNGLCRLGIEMYYVPNFDGNVSDPLYLVDGAPAWPMGTIRVTEVKAPEHFVKGNFQLDGRVVQNSIGADAHFEWVSQTDGYIRYVSDTPYLHNDPERGSVTITKKDRDFQNTTTQGDATLAGAEFSIVTKNEYPVCVDGTWYEKGQVVKVITTNANGVATTGPRSLPYGEYSVSETLPPEGYNPNDVWSQDISITSDGLTLSYEMDDAIIRGGIQVTKEDEDFNAAYPQGNATLAGAVFQIINDSAMAVHYEGKSYAKGEVVTTITTREDGIAKTGATDPPFGTFILKETVPPDEGYLLNDTWSATVTIREQGSYATATVEMTDAVMKGGLDIQKRDKETGGTEPLAKGSFEGIEYTIYNNSKHDVYVNGQTYHPGDAIMTIATDKKGFATTDLRVLPYGTYLLKETKSSEGYVLNTEWEGVIEVTEDGQFFHIDNGSNANLNQVMRSDISFIKLDGETMKRLANVAFRVTAKATGESHIIVTDENGRESLPCH